MQCNEFEDHLQRMADEGKPLDSSQPLRRHAQRCRRCRETLAAYEAILRWAASTSPTGLSDDFSQRVVRRVDPAFPRRNVGWHRIAALAIAASLLVAAAAGLLQRGRLANPSRQLAERPVIAAVPETGLPWTVIDEPSAEDIDAPGPAELPISSEELREIWLHWSGTLRGRWEPVDPLTEGIRPITASLTVALDELRNALPLVPQRPEAHQADSAMLRAAIALDRIA